MRFKPMPLLLTLAGLTTAFSVVPAHAQTASTGLLLVCNKGDHTLGIIDPVAGRQIAAINEDGVTGHEVAASPDGTRAYVPIYGNSGVGRPGTDGRLLRVIDLKGRRITQTLDFGKGLRPHCAVIGPKDGLLYVTTELDKSVVVLDPNNLQLVRKLPTFQDESHMLAITHDNTRLYTANVSPGTVTVMNLKTGRLVKIIPVSKETQRISISMDDRWAFTSDQAEPRLAVIDTSKNEVAKWIPLPGHGYGTAPTPDGHWLVVAVPQAGKVAVVDLESMTVFKTIDLPRAPQEVLVQPGGADAYVSCDASKQVAMINVKSWGVAKLIDAGAGADGLAWANTKN